MDLVLEGLLGDHDDVKIHVLGVANAAEEETQVASLFERDEALVLPSGDEGAEEYDVEQFGALADAESHQKINTKNQHIRQSYELISQVARAWRCASTLRFHALP